MPGRETGPSSRVPNPSEFQRVFKYPDLGKPQERRRKPIPGMINFFEIFRVTPGFSQDELERQKKELEERYNPNIYEVTDERAKEMSIIIKIGFDILSDPKKRKVYLGLLPDAAYEDLEELADDELAKKWTTFPG